MGLSALGSIVVLLIILLISEIASYQLGVQPIYLVVTPKKIRPNSIAAVSVSIFRTDIYGSITVRASAVRGGTFEVAYAEDTFTKPSTRILQIEMPIWAPPGYYTMRVSGWAGGSGQGYIFQNETYVMFDMKQLSIFTVMSKTVYHQEQVVRFRVIPVRRNLLPYSDRFDVYIVDPNNALVWRWLYQQPNAGGIMELEFPLADQVTYGNWSVRVDYKGFSYYKKFIVREYFFPRFDVNVTTPYLISDSAFGVCGIISANHTAGRPVRGNSTISVRLVDQPTNTTYATMNRFIPYLEGKGTFILSMGELRQLTGRQYMENTELYVRATVCDWFLDMCLEGYSYTFIYGSKPQLKFLGGRTRIFKPGMPVKAFLVVYDPSGLPLVRPNQQVVIQVMGGQNSLAQPIENVTLPVPDSGIVEYLLRPDPTGQIDRYELNAKYIDFATPIAIPDFVPPRQMFVQAYSRSFSFLQVSTTTPAPYVDQYMVFRVDTNRYTPTIYYHIISGGNIVYADELSVANGATSKTFAVALSRDMLPTARIVAYYVRSDGEVVSDSLTFFVNGSKDREISVTVNRAKDLRIDTIEVNGYARPASYMSFLGINYDWYLMGGDPSLSDWNLIDEQLSYEEYPNPLVPNMTTVQQPFIHSWNYNRDFRRRIYVPSPSFGIEANQTWEWAGMRIFSDSNRSSFFDQCNISDPSRPFSCFSNRGDILCYDQNRTCNGIVDCYTGVDEMNCPLTSAGGQLNVIITPRPPIDVFNILLRHYEIDGGWFWRSFYIKPDVYGSRIDFRVTLPNIVSDWVIGAFSVHPDTGLTVTADPPPRFLGTRRFFVVLEYPPQIKRGEQIGLRACIFNYWTYWTEALVFLEASTDYQFVTVQWRGSVSSYAPRTASGEIHNVVYLPAGESRYIHMPIVPTTFPGNITFRVCAYSFVGAQCQSGTVQVVMDGITNTYHTPLLLDLNRATEIWPTYFWIPINDVFVNPTTREHYYVVGSPYANLSIVGDVVGPALSTMYPQGTTFNCLYWDRPYYSAEASLFNLAYNMHMLKYLRFTNQLTNDVMIPALYYTQMALQRILSQYNGTYGFMTGFRDYMEPNVWVTAQTIYILADAAEIRDFENYNYIDRTLINNMTRWLVRQQWQNVSSIRGAFNETSPYVYDYKFQSKRNITVAALGGISVPNNVSLTAFCLLSLKKVLDMNMVTGAAQTEASQAVTMARDYLEARIPEMDSTFDTFELVITAAALQAAGSSQLSSIFALMQQRIRGSDMLYFANKDVAPNPMHVDNVYQYQDPRVELDNEGYAVQATAYALMVYSELAPDNASAMVRWLNSMRNTPYGFASTSDTLAAITALRRVAEAFVNRRLWIMNIDVTPAAISQTYSIQIQNTTFSQVQYVPIVKPYGSVMEKALGTGWALFQMMTKVNVEFVHQIKKPANPGFVLRKMIFTPTMRNYSVIYYTVCAKLSDSMRVRSPRSGMAVIELEIPTGYIVTNDVLRNYAISGKVPTLRHCYRKDKRVFFHLAYLTAEETCVELKVDRWYPVANMSIQNLVRVYEYYEPGTYVNDVFMMYTLFNLNICHVCGSFQCVYCPDFNGAFAALPPSALVLAFSLIALLIARRLAYQ